jgi:hypothetical protein
LVVIFVYFSHFGMLYQIKSGNPVQYTYQSIKLDTTYGIKYHISTINIWTGKEMYVFRVRIQNSVTGSNVLHGKLQQKSIVSKFVCNITSSFFVLLNFTILLNIADCTKVLLSWKCNICAQILFEK